MQFLFQLEMMDHRPTVCIRLLENSLSLPTNSVDAQACVRFRHQRSVSAHALFIALPEMAHDTADHSVAPEDQGTDESHVLQRHADAVLPPHLHLKPIPPHCCCYCAVVCHLVVWLGRGMLRKRKGSSRKVAYVVAKQRI